MSVSLLSKKQILAFTGLNTHHTNRFEEKLIRNLQDLTRIEFIFATTKCYEYIKSNLWPYAMRLAGEAINNSPSPWDNARRIPVQSSSTQLQTLTKNISNLLDV